MTEQLYQLTFIARNGERHGFSFPEPIIPSAEKFAIDRMKSGHALSVRITNPDGSEYKKWERRY